MKKELKLRIYLTGMQVPLKVVRVQPNRAFSKVRPFSDLDSDASESSVSGKDEAAVEVMKGLLSKAKRIGKYGKRNAKKVYLLAR